MPVLTRSGARSTRPLTIATSPGLVLLRGHQPQNQSFINVPQNGVSNYSDQAFEGRLFTLNASNEKSLVVCTCRADCLSCHLYGKNNYFKYNRHKTLVKPNEVNWKLQFAF